MHEELVVQLTGTAPLLMHAGRLADPLDPHAQALAQATRKTRKTRADHLHIAGIEWRGGLWLSGGAPCIPAEALEGMAVAAGRTRRAGSLVRAAVTVQDSVRLEYPGPRDIELLQRDGSFSHRCGVRVNGRTSIRTRPRFDAWHAVATFSFLPTMIDRGTLMEIIDIGGAVIGLGDYRPRFGRFRALAL